MMGITSIENEILRERLRDIKEIFKQIEIEGGVKGQDFCIPTKMYYELKECIDG